MCDFCKIGVLLLGLLSVHVCEGKDFFATASREVPDAIEKNDALSALSDTNFHSPIDEAAPWEPDEVRPSRPVFWKHATAFDPIGMAAATALDY